MKITWRQAAHYFFSNKSEVGLFTKIISGLGIVTLPVTVGDEAGNVVPVLNIITAGDDILALFGVFAIIRITMIRRKANQRRLVPRR